MTRKHKVPANIYTAILMQESGYALEARGCYTGLTDISVKDGDKYLGKKNNVEVTICMDFGMSQIYYKTARAFKFELSRLTTDLEYSVEAGTIVLADFKKRYSHREIDWWTRYNASSPTKRLVYKKLVERYL